MKVAVTIHCSSVSIDPTVKIVSAEDSTGRIRLEAQSDSPDPDALRRLHFCLDSNNGIIIYMVLEI